MTYQHTSRPPLFWMSIVGPVAGFVIAAVIRANTDNRRMEECEQKVCPTTYGVVYHPEFIGSQCICKEGPRPERSKP